MVGKREVYDLCGLGLHEPYARSSSGERGDLGSGYSDDDALARDDEEVVIVRDGCGTDEPSGLLADLVGDDTLTASCLCSVIVDLGSLAVTHL